MEPETKMSDYNQIKKRIDSNTICIIGSFPSFPHGNKDQIEKLAELAKKNNIGLHVDACLGGFVVAFAKDNGYDIGEFDFRLEGVTSLSCD